jgi:hypothetical protein
MKIKEVCIKVAGVPDKNGNVFTEEALRGAAEKDPFLQVRETHGRVELWTRLKPAKKILEASAEEGYDTP